MNSGLTVKPLLSLTVPHNSHMPFVHVTKSCAFLEGDLANAVIF